MGSEKKLVRKGKNYECYFCPRTALFFALRIGTFDFFLGGGGRRGCWATIPQNSVKAFAEDNKSCTAKESEKMYCQLVKENSYKSFSHQTTTFG